MADLQEKLAACQTQEELCQALIDAFRDNPGDKFEMIAGALSALMTQQSMLYEYVGYLQGWIELFTQQVKFPICPHDMEIWMATKDVQDVQEKKRIADEIENRRRANAPQLVRINNKIELVQ